MSNIKDVCGPIKRNIQLKEIGTKTTKVRNPSPYQKMSGRLFGTEIATCACTYPTRGVADLRGHVVQRQARRPKWAFDT